MTFVLTINFIKGDFMFNDYRILYQTEEGLVKKTVIQAQTKKEANEKAERKLEKSNIVYAQEENYYV
ncbi:hypothetical protein [Virgibacillus ainsalahensis]